MRLAHYELTETGSYFGSIPACPGAWGESDTLEGCREDLQNALESWLVVGLRHGDELPVIAGLDLNGTAHAETYQTT